MFYCLGGVVEWVEFLSHDSVEIRVVYCKYLLIIVSYSDVDFCGTDLSDI